MRQVKSFEDKTQKTKSEELYFKYDYLDALSKFWLDLLQRDMLNPIEQMKREKGW